MKKKACSYVGIQSFNIILKESISENELIYEIHKLNNHPNVHGILVQMPLPSHIKTENIIKNINPKKDVDGFHPLNMGKLLLGQDTFIPCTPHGIKVLLEKSNINIEGKHVVIIGRSNIVGKPLAALLLQKQKGCNATVTVVNSKTENIKKFTLSADILISAIGKPKFIKEDMVKKDSIVIDVGINKILNNGKNHIVGDVDFENVKKIASKITTVPGGVGPMTIAMLLENTYKSYMEKNES